MPLLPPSTTTVLPAKRMASEHAVGIGRLLRDRLGHVPVLGDLAVPDAQDVHDRKPATPGREFRMRVHDHEITLRDDTLDGIVGVRLISKKGLKEDDCCLS